MKMIGMMKKMTKENNKEEEIEFNFKDFKNNDMFCDKCGASMGCCSEQVLLAFLCDNCYDELEEEYKSKHPEEYEK